ncbi:SulP family inorganic anion transporter [Pseudohalioglobus sediminis]|uniref:SulP family inorganic anion transporter n=1 Tax=Pseudohalioglobus sediminis TaxID=2606449 RepID=A0A5B0WZV9_9GAMM|nr:SulP family inorganic anion transporter [Pseudohalioglobus sediminis]KAA1192593.1 SulP family inorganic anion transporter [Pseudohalioglobus sediminis]
MKSVFNTFEFNNLRGDISGGVTAAIVSLPMALAFGVASGAGAEAGLYGAILVGFFAATFGGTPTLISEPTGPMTVVMTAVITTMIASEPEHGLAMAFTVVMIAGVFQILLGTLRLGKYITLMPYSVISGFMSGIGVILILLQIAPFLGQASPPGGVTATLASFPDLWTNIKPQETLLGVFTLAILFFTPEKIGRYLPPQLLALVLGTVVSLTLLADVDIRRIGEISLGLPSIILPTFTPEQVTSMLLDGMVLGTLGCIDALLTSVISDSLTRQEHKSDKELVGQGVGNLMAGLFGGLPGAGATMGTVVNIQTGARSALSGVVRALVLVVVVLGAAELTKTIPLAVLAGIALKVGLNILDWSFVKRAHRVSLHATLIMYGVMLLTVFIDLIVAVGLGVFIANIITIERLSAVQNNSIKAMSDADDAVPLTPKEKQLLDSAAGKVLLVYFSGPMIFGMSKAIAREHNNIQRYQSIVLDLKEVPLIDTTISLAIENTIRDAVGQERRVFIVKPRDQVKTTLERLGVFELIPGAQLAETREEALEKAISNLQAMDAPTQGRV